MRFESSSSVLQSLLGLSEDVLDSLGPQQIKQLMFLFLVFANSGFRYFEALDGPLGPVPEWAPNVVRKWSQN